MFYYPTTSLPHYPTILLHYYPITLLPYCPTFDQLWVVQGHFCDAIPLQHLRIHLRSAVEYRGMQYTSVHNIQIAIISRQEDKGLISE